MEKVEHLESELYDHGVDIVRRCYKGLKGYYRAYSDGYAIMAISPALTFAERTCVTYHEAGHHFTMNEPGQDSRNESRADRWAAKKLVSVQNIIEALVNGCRNPYEVADHLQVSENFLYKTLDIYRLLHGEYYETGDWVIAFRPTLFVLNRISEQYFPE